MSTKVSPLAGKPAPRSVLVDVPRLVTAYYTGRPDPSVPAQRVAFGTSGHRGSSFDASFNEWHVLAITQAICEHRARSGIDGPLFLGIDTHALSQPACASALEVLAANGVTVMLAPGDDYTPTPAISHAILTHNRGRDSKRADGIVVTPSHNPPDNGGFKYNPPDGGPAGNEITGWIEARANALLEQALDGVKRFTYANALRAPTTLRHDYLNAYVGDLGSVIDLDLIRDAKIRMGVDPLGGAGVHYWARIAERYRLDLSVVSDEVDPTFRFMTLDWDGRIRMDPSSPHAMQRLLELKDRFDIAFACDTDHDRHGIVTPHAGLLPANHYLSVAIDYLFRHRPQWGANAAVGKTVVSTRIIDLVATRLARRLYEVPVGFKWFAPGLLDGSLGFGGEESAGAAFVRRDGSAWTTDKDGIAPALLAAEMSARLGRDPGALYEQLASELGNPVADRVEAPATRQQKAQLAALAPARIDASELAGEKIDSVLDRAPGNGAPIGGIKVIAASGWFAARPSGTEDIYKIYAESFRGPDHLQRILTEAQAIVDRAIASPVSMSVPLEPSDEAMLDELQRRSFGYFLDNVNPRNGLVADTTRAGSPSSIAVIGFALSVYPVGVERGWIDRGDAVQRTLSALRFFMGSDQSGEPGATGHRGFYFHFLDMHSGTRVWLSELSLIDTAFLIAGMLTAAAYFSADTPDEAELRGLADALYRRVEWRWAQRDGSALMHGWKPESGFLHYGWEGYSEALLLYVLGLGSPTHALTPQSFVDWTVTYQWENLYGHDFLCAGPLFIHQYSHAWIDFRGIRDAFMREKNCDYFENSRRAAYVQREYTMRNPRGFAGYGADCWGLSAGDGPSAEPRLVHGRYQAFYGYAARGVPYGPDDGTICGSSTLSSLVFAPEIALPAIRKLVALGSCDAGALVQASGFNPTVTEAGPNGWSAEGAFGLDQGMVVMMIENFRTGLFWQLSRGNRCIREGLRRAGFTGGWL